MSRKSPSIFVSVCRLSVCPSLANWIPYQFDEFVCAFPLPSCPFSLAMWSLSPSPMLSELSSPSASQPSIGYGVILRHTHTNWLEYHRSSSYLCHTHTTVVDMSHHPMTGRNWRKKDIRVCLHLLPKTSVEAVYVLSLPCESLSSFRANKKFAVTSKYVLRKTYTHHSWPSSSVRGNPSPSNYILFTLAGHYHPNPSSSST